MTNRIHRTLAIATLILGAAAAMTACSAGDNGPTAQPAAATATGEPTTTPPAAPPVAEPAGSGNPSATTAPTRRPADVTKTDDGCPIGEAALLKVIRNDKDYVPTSALTEVTCHKGWATAGQVIDKDWWAKHDPVQPVTFIFRYDPNAGHWNIASAGTGGDCPAAMPTDIRKHFRYCRG